MNKKHLGILLLWAGFISGALATVWQAAPEKAAASKSGSGENSSDSPSENPDNQSQVDEEVDGWQLINWTWYSVSVAAGVFGIVLIRVEVSGSNKKSDETKASLAEIQESLIRLSRNVEQLAKESKELPPSQILSRIDDDLADDFLTFADGRESMIAEHGLAVFADVMTHFAAGERAVNRAWCASADGYVNEAEDCLDRAAEMLRLAYQKLEQKPT